MLREQQLGCDHQQENAARRAERGQADIDQRQEPDATEGKGEQHQACGCRREDRELALVGGGKSRRQREKHRRHFDGADGDEKRRQRSWEDVKHSVSMAYKAVSVNPQNVSPHCPHNPGDNARPNGRESWP